MATPRSPRQQPCPLRRRQQRLCDRAPTQDDPVGESGSVRKPPTGLSERPCPGGCGMYCRYKGSGLRQRVESDILGLGVRVGRRYGLDGGMRPCYRESDEERGAARAACPRHVAAAHNRVVLSGGRGLWVAMWCREASLQQSIRRAPPTILIRVRPVGRTPVLGHRLSAIERTSLARRTLLML